MPVIAQWIVLGFFFLAKVFTATGVAVALKK